MKKVLMIIVCAIALIACTADENGIKTGKYGMMGSDTPQYTAVLFLTALYKDDNLDRVVNASTERFGRIIKGYHTNKNVQRQVLNLRLDSIEVEPVSGGTLLFSELQDKANIEMKIIGYYQNDKVFELKTLSMVKVKGDWKVQKITNTVP